MCLRVEMAAGSAIAGCTGSEDIAGSKAVNKLFWGFRLATGDFAVASPIRSASSFELEWLVNQLPDWHAFDASGLIRRLPNSGAHRLAEERMRRRYDPERVFFHLSAGAN